MGVSKFSPASQRGVDATPTASSTNLVESGGIRSAINAKADQTDLASIHATGSTNTTGAKIDKGTYFYLNDVLVQATSDIATGANYTNGTNYRVASDNLNSIGLLKEYQISFDTSVLGTIGNNQSKVNIKNGICHINIGYVDFPSKSFQTAWLDIGTIPDGARPNYAGVAGLIGLSSSGLIVAMARLAINTEGVISIRPALGVTANSLCGLTLSYPV